MAVSRQKWRSHPDFSVLTNFPERAFDDEISRNIKLSFVVSQFVILSNAGMVDYQWLHLAVPLVHGHQADRLKRYDEVYGIGPALSAARIELSKFSDKELREEQDYSLSSNRDLIDIIGSAEAIIRCLRHLKLGSDNQEVVDPNSRYMHAVLQSSKLIEPKRKRRKPRGHRVIDLRDKAAPRPEAARPDGDAIRTIGGR